MEYPMDIKKIPMIHNLLRSNEGAGGGGGGGDEDDADADIEGYAVAA